VGEEYSRRPPDATLSSDGSRSTLEMARAAQARGYEYIAITNHSKGLKIAGGIDEEQLQQQFDEIESVNALLRAVKVADLLCSDLLN
jgi:DNA polymerase (family 10)